MGVEGLIAACGEVVPDKSQRCSFPIIQSSRPVPVFWGLSLKSFDD
jgi:hypothetical protein